MGADGKRVGRRRPMRIVAYVGCGAVLLTGCASMPDSGDLRDVEASQRPDAQVRVFAMPPRENARPDEIVQSFLEALTSDDPQFETAKRYLTKDARNTWQPYRSTTVLADGPSAVKHNGSREATGDYEYALTGDKVAEVDRQFAYEPAEGTYNERVHLTQQEEADGTRQWRIDSLPQGVVLGRSDFQRHYVSVNKYYFASNSPSADRPGTVADPVYVRRQVDPVTHMVRALLKGPTRWLAPVVRSSFPTGVALRKGVQTLTPDDQNKLTVPLNRKADGVGQSQCSEMAAQLLYTLQDLTPTGIDEVELQRSDGSQLCVLGENRAEIIASHGTGKHADYEYFIDGDHRLVRIPAGTNQEPTPVPGALGEGDTELRAAAISRDEESAAGVSLDGRSLYVGSLTSGGSLGDPVIRSKAKTQADGLTTPSWDASDDLWVADRDPREARLLLLEKGRDEPLEVKTPGIEGQIEAVRVAADGVRIALIVQKAGKTSLLIGRIERQDGATGRPVVTIHEPRSVAPQLEEATAMSWAGDSRLVVVGQEKGGVQQIRYVQVDGSTPVGPAPSALTGVKEIAAFEDERLPLVAHSEDGIVRLSSGSQWQKVVKLGTAPVYPG